MHNPFHHVMNKTAPLAIISMLVGALLLVGCGSSVAPAATATPTLQPTPSPTPILNSTFTSQDGIYTFQFPGTWTTTPLSNSVVINGVSVASSDQTDLFVTLPLDEGFATKDYPTFLNSFMSGAGAKSITVKTTSQSVPAGANTWTDYDGTATLNGNPSQTSIFGLTHDGKTFFVIIIAANTNADSIGTTYFLPMLTSLKFLK
jgi:hypothetical protein